jgi:hypothetical protein
MTSITLKYKRTRPSPQSLFGGISKLEVVQDSIVQQNDEKTDHVNRPRGFSKAENTEIKFSFACQSKVKQKTSF